MSGETGVQFHVNLDVNGVAAYQCEDATGATAPGHGQVQVQGGATSSFTPSKKAPTFTTQPAVLAAPAVSASQAGCADGTTAVHPTLTTFKVELILAPSGDGTFLVGCALDRTGLRGTIPLTGC
jgi:hypothetical protein